MAPSTLTEFIAKHRALCTGTAAVDHDVANLEFKRIDVLVDEFERGGKYKNHTQVDGILKLAQLGRKARAILPQALEALEVMGKSLEQVMRLGTHQDGNTMECESAYRALAEVERILGGGK